MKKFVTRTLANALFITGLVIVALAASLFLAACTSAAPWGYSDSAIYFASARNLANGIGLGEVGADGTFSRLAVFAPLYPIVLSFFARPGIDLIEASRILNIALFFILLFVSGGLLSRVTRSRLIGLCFAILLGTCQVLIYVFCGIMSDPLAFTLGVPGLLLVLLAIKEDSWKTLLLAAVCSGLSLLSRYAFAAVPLTGLFLLLFFSKWSWKKRLLKSGLFAVVSFGPMLVWLATEMIRRQSFGARSFAASFDISERSVSLIKGIYEIVKHWFPYSSSMIPGLSYKVGALLLLAVFGGLILLMLLSFFRRKIPLEDRVGVTLPFTAALVYLASYLLVFFASYVFTPEQIPINERLLSPLFPGIFLVLLSAALGTQRMLKSRFNIPAMAVIITLFFVMFNLPLLEQYLAQTKNPGSYTASVLRTNPIFNEVDQLPEGTPILSNVPDILLFYSNRSSYYLGNKIPSSGSYIDWSDKERLNHLLDEECGVLVLLKPEIARWYENRPGPLGDQEFNTLTDEWVELVPITDGALLASENCFEK